MVATIALKIADVTGVKCSASDKQALTSISVSIDTSLEEISEELVAVQATIKGWPLKK